MLRRLFFLLFGTLFLVLAILAFWQPDFLKQKLLNHVAEKISKTTPYEVVIGRVSGNVFTGLSLHGAHLSIKPDHIELLRAKEINIGISWGALLLHKTIRIQSLDWVEPTVHLVIDEKRRIALPRLSSSASSSSSSFSPLSISRFTIEKGQVIVANHSLTPEKELRLENMTLKARGTLRQIDIQNFQMNLGNGSVAMRGRMMMNPSFSGEFVVDDNNLSLEKILALAFPVPGALRLIHSGEWTVHTDVQRTLVGMTGRLSDAPITFQGNVNQENHYRAELTWKNVSFNRLWPAASTKPGIFSASFDVFGKGLLVSGKGKIATRMEGASAAAPWANADVRLSRGLGTFEINLGMADSKAVITGKADLPHRSAEADYTASGAVLNGQVQLAGHAATSAASWRVDGRGTMKNAAWQNRLLNKMDLSFSATPRSETWDLAVSNLQFQKGAAKPMDIQSGRFTGQGLTPQWQSTASLQFRNGSRMDFGGAITRGKGFWQLAWQHLTMVFPSGGSWAATRPGAVTWRAPRRISIDELALANGTQTLEVREGVLGKDDYRFDFSAKQLDPAPWTKLFIPEVTLSGTLGALLQVHEEKSHLSVDGFVNGKFPRLSITPIGLVVQNAVVELRSSNQKIEVARFTGKTKKGDIELTGGSQLPQLDYSLRAHKLALSPSASTKGMGDLDLHLGGTVEYPILTGSLGMTEAIYTAPKKEQKQKPVEAVAASSSTATTVSLWKRGTLDLTVQWPRDVWYRDGVSSIETHGDLHIKKAAENSNVILSGTISSVRGSYSYYGRAFTLQSGEIQFVGTPDLNPQLNIEAVYASGPTTVYLDITGTAEKPILKMHSNPPLSDQDIVSVIVFGQPLSELRSRTGGPSSNQEMMQAVGGVLGSYVSKGLNQTGVPILNFDLLNIQPADQGGSQLTVGRYLTRRLFISYGQTVQGSAEKSITADYFLTDKWTLQGASDSVEGNYMDFLFRYPLNKRGSPANNPPLPVSPFRNTLDQPVYQQPFRTPMQ